jgi:hypothetical protein
MPVSPSARYRATQLRGSGYWAVTIAFASSSNVATSGKSDVCAGGFFERVTSIFH